jgi:hypothetical protein
LFTCASGSGTLSVTKRGTIELTIIPTPSTSSSSFQFTSGSDTSAKTITDRQTLVISTSDMVSNSDSYSISFSMKNIALIKAKFTADSPVEYRPLHKPEVSRVVDFSKNDGGKPLYNKDEVVFGKDDGDTSSTGQEYDAMLGHWVTKDSEIMGDIGESGYNQFFNKNIVGDFYCLMEEIGSIPPLVYCCDNDFGIKVDAVNSSRLATARYWSGLARISTPYGVYDPKANAWINIYRCNAGTKYRMIYGGFTWPLNVVLWAGAVGETLHQKQWQSDGSGNITADQAGDASLACPRTTRDVCAKLKADWGANLRMYVVKYRKQTAHKHKITGAEVPFDTQRYSYLNYCAGPGNIESSGSAPYMYDTANETELKNALAAIAADIKTFAEYQEAKIVPE